MPANHADSHKNCMARRPSDIIRGVIKKNVIFKFRVLCMFDFGIFFSVILVHIAVIYVDNISHFGWSVCF